MDVGPQQGLIYFFINKFYKFRSFWNHKIYSFLLKIEKIQENY